jgi:hypothetical protein
MPNRAIEMHDSVLADVSFSQGEARLHFSSVCIHQSEGVPLREAGSSWVQEAVLRIHDATMEGAFSEFPVDLADGQTRMGENIGAQTQSDVVPTFSINAARLASHEPVLLTFSIKNETNVAVHYDLGRDMKEVFVFVVTLPNGETIRAPRLRKSGFSRIGDIRILPGQTYTYSAVNLSWNPYSSLNLGGKFLYGGQVLKNGASAYAPAVQRKIQLCENKTGLKNRLVRWPRALVYTFSLRQRIKNTRLTAPEAQRRQELATSAHNMARATIPISIQKLVPTRPSFFRGGQS